MDWTILTVGCLAPGLLIWFVGLAITISRSAQEVRRRGACMAAVGFGLFILGCGVSLVLQGVLDGKPMLVFGGVVAFGPAATIVLWRSRRMFGAGDE